MQLAALGSVELVVKILLKQVVCEAVEGSCGGLLLPPRAGQALTRRAWLRTPIAAPGDEVVLPAQAGAEAGDHLAHRPAGHLGHQLAGKVVALHAGGREDLAFRLRQALDPFRDGRLDTGG